MSVAAHVAPWNGTVYRHIAAGARYDVLDFRFAGRDPGNRWNEGEPTLYLASDATVAIGEFARHFREERTPALAATVERQMYRLTIALDEVLDLCTPAVWQALGLDNAPYCFLDKVVARATARFARSGLGVQAIRVPSMVFLDELDHWCLVVFLEKLPADPRRFITHVERGSVVRIRPTRRKRVRPPAS